MHWSRKPDLNGPLPVSLVPFRVSLSEFPTRRPAILRYTKTRCQAHVPSKTSLFESARRCGVRGSTNPPRGPSSVEPFGNSFLSVFSAFYFVLCVLADTPRGDATSDASVRAGSTLAHAGGDECRFMQTGIRRLDAFAANASRTRTRRTGVEAENSRKRERTVFFFCLCRQRSVTLVCAFSSLTVRFSCYLKKKKHIRVTQRNMGVSDFDSIWAPARFQATVNSNRLVVQLRVLDATRHL